MLLILVVTASLQALRCLKTTDPLPVISMEPFAMCIGSGSDSLSNVAKLFLSPIKCSDAPELRIQKGVIISV